MYCTIIPANRILKHKKLKFIERLIYVHRKPQVELIIYGTSKGYDYLIGILQSFIDNTSENQNHHSHLDDFYIPELVKRSINIEITDPLKIWSKDKILPHLWDEIFEKPLPTYLPKQVKHSTPERYREIKIKQEKYYLSLK